MLDKPYKNKFWLGVYELDERGKEISCLAICINTKELLKFFSIDATSSEATRISKRLYWIFNRNKVRGKIQVKGVNYRLRKIKAYESS